MAVCCLTPATTCHSNLAEAIKCYRNALRIQPGNVQILRDLSVLQIDVRLGCCAMLLWCWPGAELTLLCPPPRLLCHQVRDLDGATESRRQLLTIKSDNKAHWIGFCMTHHMAGNLHMARCILDSYEGTLESKREASKDSNAMVMYKCQLLLEDDKPQEALEHLEVLAKATTEPTRPLHARARSFTHSDMCVLVCRQSGSMCWTLASLASLVQASCWTWAGQTRPCPSTERCCG